MSANPRISLVNTNNKQGELIQTGSQRFAYDAAGNLLHRGGRYDPKTHALTNEAGQIAERITYDGHFGEIMEHTKHEITHNPYGYTGREMDTLRLYYYRARYYSPSLHRFLSPDPIEHASGDYNWYRYVGNDPVNRVDPSGHKWNAHDYMTHYLRKNPSDVSLKQTGLYRDFINSPQIKKEMNRVFNTYEKQLKTKLEKKCKHNCSMATEVLDAHKEDSPYNFQWAIGETIIVMGNGTMFNKGKCTGTMNCKTKKFSGTCNLHFYVRDWFKDPYDWFDIIPGEQGGGTPYRLLMDTFIRRNF